MVPPLVRRLIHDLAPHPAYVLNLRWDVLVFNTAADALFGFGAHAPERRNLLWLLFTDPVLHARFARWEQQAPQLLAAFRRDYARASQQADIQALVDELERVAPDFRQWWRQHQVHVPDTGVHTLLVDGKPEAYEHTALTIDEDRNLRLVVYARQLQE